MLQIYRLILEYPSNIYFFLDIFQLSTLFYSIILKLVLTMTSTFLPCKRPNVERSLGSSKFPVTERLNMMSNTGIQAISIYHHSIFYHLKAINTLRNAATADATATTSIIQFCFTARLLSSNA